MDPSFANKRALVTGGASGIGKGIALRLVSLGAKVTVVDISQPLLDNLKKEAPTIAAVRVDLSDWKATKECIRSILPIDLLVNNAGIAFINPLIDVTEDEVDKSFSVNIKATINVTQTVIEDHVKNGTTASIVNISSQASKVALSNHSVYSATKAAIDGFTRVVAADHAPNVRINCVNPTVVMTELGRTVWGDPSVKEPMLSKIPMRRFAEIDDVVDAVTFLLSDKAKMITGSCLPVDGGYIAC